MYMYCLTTVYSAHHDMHWELKIIYVLTVASGKLNNFSTVYIGLANKYLYTPILNFTVAGPELLKEIYYVDLYPWTYFEFYLT